MSKIMKDEISSIIKEKIDGFELNIDEPIKQERKAIKIAIVGSDMMHHPYGLKAAIRAATINHQAEIICGSEHHIKDLIIEQMNFEKQYGWYRKFEKKRF